MRGEISIIINGEDMKHHQYELQTMTTRALIVLELFKIEIIRRKQEPKESYDRKIYPESLKQRQSVLRKHLTEEEIKDKNYIYGRRVRQNRKRRMHTGSGHDIGLQGISTHGYLMLPEDENQKL